MTAVLLLTGFGPSRSTRALVAPAAVGWFLLIGGAGVGYSAWGWFALSCSAASLLVLIVDWPAAPATPLRVDVVVNSASGNTRHLAQSFVRGLKAAGAAVTLHRFHYYRDFRAALDGDALVVAFPIYGFKPPWPFLAWLLRDLPRGRARPAFVLYSAAMVPENAGLLLWLILGTENVVGALLGRAAAQRALRARSALLDPFTD